MNDRKAIEEWELKTLAPYALTACESQGRRFAEDEHAYRTCFQRDRDRIIHCAAFRRLEYKTQVFLNWSGDHFRTRLTHTIEVAQAARTIARSLGLNEDLTEAISLAHDLGHTPFGHAGEHAMRELMKHRTDYDKPLFKDLEERESPSLEAQVANSADEISYNAHDTDDGLYSGLLKWDAARESELFVEAEEYARANVPEGEEDLLRYQLVRRLKDLQVTDLLQYSAARITELKISTVQDVLEHQSKDPIIDFSPEFKKKVKGLKLMLYHKLYMHRNVRRGMEKSTRFMKEMFERYVSEQYLMPGGFHKRIADGVSVYRVACDFISGMTDRYALEQYKKLFDPDTW